MHKHHGHAAKTDDKEKAEAIVTFMKYITSEESVKQLTLEGAVFLSPKLDMEDPDVQGTGGLLGEYLALNANAEEEYRKYPEKLKHSSQFEAAVPVGRACP